MVKSPWCSCWGPTFHSQHPHGGSQSSLTPVPGDQNHLWLLKAPGYASGVTDMHAGKTLVHIKSKQQEGKTKKPWGMDAYYSQHFRGWGGMIPTLKSSSAIFQVWVDSWVMILFQRNVCWGNELSQKNAYRAHLRIPVWSSAPIEKMKQCICNPNAGDGRYLPIPRVSWLSSLTIWKASER